MTKEIFTGQEKKEIQFYLDKFAMKMTGCEEQTARSWVQGINHKNPKVTEAIWNKIERNFYRKK